MNKKDFFSEEEIKKIFKDPELNLLKLIIKAVKESKEEESRNLPDYFWFEDYINKLIHDVLRSQVMDVLKSRDKKKIKTLYELRLIQFLLNSPEFQISNTNSRDLHILQGAYELILDEWPSSIWAELSEIYFFLGKLDKSIEASNNATRLDTDNNKAWYYYGRAYFKKKDYVSAIFGFICADRKDRSKNLKSIQIGFDDILYHLSKAYCMKGDFEQALLRCEELIRSRRYYKKATDLRKKIIDKFKPTEKEIQIISDTIEISVNESSVLFEMQINSETKINFKKENGRIVEILGFEAGIKKIPDSINILSCLKTIELWEGDISEIPETLFEIESLESISIHDAKIKKIPDSIKKLKNLRVLSITGNLLTEIPDCIGDLENLEILQLDNNQIELVPVSIGNLKNLNFLDLNGNRISKLPNSIVNLPLGRLGVENNLLTEIPSFINQFESVWDIDFTGNPISNLPKSIGKFNLKEGMKYDAFEVLFEEIKRESFNQGEIIVKDAEKPCLIYPGCPYGQLVECFCQGRENTKYECNDFGHDCPIFYLMEPITDKIEKIPENYQPTQFKENLRDKEWFNNK